MPCWDISLAVGLFRCVVGNNHNGRISSTRIGSASMRPCNLFMVGFCSPVRSCVREIGVRRRPKIPPGDITLTGPHASQRLLIAAEKGGAVTGDQTARRPSPPPIPPWPSLKAARFVRPATVKPRSPPTVDGSGDRQGQGRLRKGNHRLKFPQPRHSHDDVVSAGTPAPFGRNRQGKLPRRLV